MTKSKSKAGPFKRKMPISLVGTQTGTTFTEDEMVYVLEAFQLCWAEKPTARNLFRGKQHVRTWRTLWGYLSQLWLIVAVEGWKQPKCLIIECGCSDAVIWWNSGETFKKMFWKNANIKTYSQAEADKVGCKAARSNKCASAESVYGESTVFARVIEAANKGKQAQSLPLLGEKRLEGNRPKSQSLKLPVFRWD